MKKLKRKLKNTEIRVPSRVVELINQSDYKRKDELFVIIDLIYRRQSTFKTKAYSHYLYINISQEFLSKFIPKNNIKSGLIHLMSRNILDVNTSYNPGSFPKSYRINKSLLDNPIKVTITSSIINKKYNVYRESLRVGKVKNNEKTKTKYLKEFNIDYTAAIEATYQEVSNNISDLAISKGVYLSNSNIISFLKGEGSSEVLTIIKEVLIKESGFFSELNRLNIHQHLVENINNNFLYFKRNASNGRLDSNLSTLPGYLRKFVKTDKELFHIDVCNSQPYFLYCTLKNDISVSNEDLEKYGELVTEGKIYDFYAAKWNSTAKVIIDRKTAKDHFFKILFSKVTSYSKYKDVFRAEFPTIMEWVDRKNSVHNNTVANEMTLKESFTILDVIKPKLSKLKIEPYTIHDSFLCNEDEVDTIISVINDTLDEMYGSIPKLHIDNLLELTTDDVEEFDVEDNYDYGDIELF
tara:strand:- start:165 stop:1562 length:1398 start_codon:yes stop_codon:yes gene_type:complete